MSSFLQSIWDGVTYDVIKIVVLSLVMTAAMDRIAKIFTDRLKEWRQQVIFCGGTFLIFIAIFSVIGTRTVRPDLQGSLINVIAGAPSGSNRQTIAVFSLTIINAGAMQTIVKNWRVTAMSNNRTYAGVFGIMPEVFTFNSIPSNGTKNQPTSVTYHREDNLIERTTKPVEIGGLAAGILFVVFDDIDTGIFTGGADFKITYEDVLSKQYELYISSSAKADLITAMPGVHTELACPIPPGGLPNFTPTPPSKPN
jgi:hypothetical protein